MVVDDLQVEEGREPLCLARWERRQVAIQEDQAEVLVFNDYILSTTTRGL